MKKKIFILTGEPSGDRLASKAIIELKKINPNVDYLSVGGENLNSINVKSIYELSEITYLGFTTVLLNILKIKKQINYTADKIIEYNPDVLFSVDSPDFTLRVAKIVKEKKSSIKIIHYVAPQVWIWRENRVKKMKNIIDHLLLLFNFEKKYFDKEDILSTVVGHPLLDKENKINIDVKESIKNDNQVISIFPGSRFSEIKVLMPILINFVSLASTKYNNFSYIFHSTKVHEKKINNYLLNSKLSKCEVVSDEKEKKVFLEKSIFAVTKSGTVSLEICNTRIPSLIIYKMNFLNYLIIKLLVKVKFANIINIIADKEIIPELLQSKCNAKNIYKNFVNLIENPGLMTKQVNASQEIINKMKSTIISSNAVALILNKNLN
jgi:lipid-A-disaccharide synthase